MEQLTFSVISRLRPLNAVQKLVLAWNIFEIPLGYSKTIEFLEEIQNQSFSVEVSKSEKRKAHFSLYNYIPRNSI